MNRTSLLTVSVLVALLLLASTASAEVRIRLRVIQASNAGATIDPILRDVYDQLGSLFSFRSYQLLRDQTLELSGAQPIQIPVHPGRAIEITLVGQRRNMTELQVKIKREGSDVLNTRVRISPGRTVLIGGPKHGGGVVIFAVTAQ